MKKRNLICAASILMIKQIGFAQVQSAMTFDARNNKNRVNISYKVFMNHGSGLSLDPNSLDSVLKNIDTNGIYADENSEINVH